MAKKLTSEEVEHIAALARIGVFDEEKSKLQEDLGSVLDYIDKLQEVDVSGVEPTGNITGLEDQTRKDENGSTSSPQDGSTHADAKELRDMAPETKDGFVKVKKVL